MAFHSECVAECRESGAILWCIKSLSLNNLLIYKELSSPNRDVIRHVGILYTKVWCRISVIRHKKVPVLKVFVQTIYVQIAKNALNLLHVESNKQSHISAAEPFSTERLAVAHFQIAEKLLNKELQKIFPKSFFSASPIVVMHQLYQAEGGLCEVEVRILKELALGAGARHVYLWEGEPLSREQLLRKVYEK